VNDDEKKVVAGLVDVLDQFEEMRPNFPLHQVKMLLKLALDEGKSQKYYSAKWQYPTATVSRAMLDMGRRMRGGLDGLGLIDERVSTHSLREHEVYLSLKGKTMLQKMIKRLCK
jgi:hypothetical protein